MSHGTTSTKVTDAEKFFILCRSTSPSYEEADLEFAELYSTQTHQEAKLLQVLMYKKSSHEDLSLRKTRIRIALKLTKLNKLKLNNFEPKNASEFIAFFPELLLASEKNPHLGELRSYWDTWRTHANKANQGLVNQGVQDEVIWLHQLCKEDSRFGWGVVNQPRLFLSVTQVLTQLKRYLEANRNSQIKALTEALTKTFIECCALSTALDPGLKGAAVNYAKALPREELLNFIQFCLSDFPAQESDYEKYFQRERPELKFLLTITRESAEEVLPFLDRMDPDMKDRTLLDYLHRETQEQLSTTQESTKSHKKPRISSSKNHSSTSSETKSEPTEALRSKELLSKLFSNIPQKIKASRASEPSLRSDSATHPRTNHQAQSNRSSKTVTQPIAQQPAKKPRTATYTTPQITNADAEKKATESSMPTTDEMASQTSINWAFNISNSTSWINLSPLLSPTKKYVVFYRGQHWLRSGLTPNAVTLPEDSEFRTAMLENIQKVQSAPNRPLYSPCLSAETNEKKRNDLHQQLLTWHETISRTGPVIHGSFHYPTQAHYVHTYFSNNYAGFLTDLQSRGTQVGFASSLHGSQAQESKNAGTTPLQDGDPIDTLNVSGQAIPLPSFPLQHHPFFSFAEGDPLHSLLYAYGSKTASEAMHRDRLRPNYQRNLKPKNSVVGEVFMLTIPFDELTALQQMDIWSQYARGHVHIDTRIVSERETTFIGQIDQRYIVLKVAVEWPSFDCYDSSYYQRFGLDKVRWDTFKKQCEAAVALKFLNPENRTLYRPFKKAVSNFIIQHVRGRLQFHAYNLLKDNHYYRDPSGLLWPIPPTRRVLTLLREMYIHGDQIAAALVLTERYPLLTEIPVEKHAIAYPLAKLLGTHDVLQWYGEIYTRLGHKTDMTVSAAVIRRLEALSTFLEKHLAEPAKLQEWIRTVRGTQDNNTHQSTTAINKLPASQLAESQSAMLNIPQPRAPLPLPNTTLSSQSQETLHVTHKIVQLNREVLHHNHYGQLLNIVQHGTFLDLINFKLQISMLYPNDTEFKDYWVRITDRRDKENLHLLHWIAKRETDDCSLLDFLLNISRSFKGSAVDAHGKQPLHYAAQRGHVMLAERILQHYGALSPNCLDHEGKTPLHYACQQGHLDMVMCLLNYRADVMLKDKAECTPLEYWPNKTLSEYHFLTALQMLLTTLDEVISGRVHPIALPTQKLKQEKTQTAIQRLRALVTGFPTHWDQLKHIQYLETRTLSTSHTRHTFITVLAHWGQHESLRQLKILGCTFQPLAVNKSNQSLQKESALTIALHQCQNVSAAVQTCAAQTVEVILQDYNDQPLITDREWEKQLIRKTFNSSCLANTVKAKLQTLAGGSAPAESPALAASTALPFYERSSIAAPAPLPSPLPQGARE